MATIQDLPTEIIRDIFIKNKMTIVDAEKLHKAFENVDEIFADKIWTEILCPFYAAQFDYHLKFCETGNLFLDPDRLVPYSKKLIKRNY